MKDMERQGFDESWKQAFEDAAFSPSENVWTNIELELEREKASQLKRRLVFYQLLAAASVVFAISVVLGMYTMNNRQKEMLAARIAPANTEKKVRPDDASASSADNSGKQQVEQQAKTDQVPSVTQQHASPIVQSLTSKQNNNSRTNDKINGGNDKGNADTQVVENSIAMMNENESAPARVLDDAVFKSPTNSELPPLVDQRKPQLVLPATAAVMVADPVQQMMTRLQERERELIREDEEVKEEKKNEKRDDEKLWTSLGFAAGSFSTVNSEGSSAVQSAQLTAAHQEAKASGVTYSMGLNLGTKLSERWVFQGGVNYLTQNSTYAQNNVLLVPDAENKAFTAKAPNIKDIDNLQAPENLANTAPFDVNNNVRYLSIPMQAGFLIINRGLGLQLNAGLATDLFLQNTITATYDGDKIDASKSDFGEDSAFRPVNLSGLMGTEVSYKFGRHYRIALNPGLKYPFNSIYKSDAYKATRLSFDVGLRFRYIFH
jgi:hypothetical protein